LQDIIGHLFDELSDEEKTTVARARKVQAFLITTFPCRRAFTGLKGVLVPIEELSADSHDSWMVKWMNILMQHLICRKY